MGEDPALGRHHSQVAAIAGTLREAAREMEAKLPAEAGIWLLERARSIERQVLDLHRLWGFFRAKFALRYVPWLDDALVGVDDFAWACYAPVQAFVAADRRREPPLVHFAGGTSPFLMPRGSTYVVEPLPDGGLREPQFDELMRREPPAYAGADGTDGRDKRHSPRAEQESPGSANAAGLARGRRT